MKINYETLDDTLSQIEPLLTSLAGKKKLKGIDITRWRWDEPDLMLSWRDGDLGKNIHVLIDKESNKVQIECNAWKDYDTEEGRVRKAVCSQKKKINIDNLDNLDNLNVIREAIEEVYEEVAEWKEGKLVSAKKTGLTKGAKIEELKKGEG